jgi:hypothetical protein
VQVASDSARKLPDSRRIRVYLGPHTHSGLVLGYGVADLAELKQGVSLPRKAFLQTSP